MQRCRAWREEPGRGRSRGENGSAALDERTLFGRIVPDSLDHRRCLAVHLTDWEGNRNRIRFDDESFLIARIEYPVFTGLGVDSMALQMEDYREVSGIRTPFRVTIC